MDKKCFYCNRPEVIGELELSKFEPVCYCSESCRAEINYFMNYYKSYEKWSFIAIGIVLFLMPLFFLTSDLSREMTLFGQIIMVGVVAIKFPLPTPETSRWLGLKRSVVYTRWLGFTLVIGGLLAIFFF